MTADELTTVPDGTQQARVFEVGAGELVFIATPHGVVSVFVGASYATFYSPKADERITLYAAEQAQQEGEAPC